MKLYHGTKIENLEGIIENGLYPQITDKISNESERILEAGIFAFTTLKDAKDFARDNSGGGEIAILEIEIDENDYNILDDPEYDGEAKFIESDENIFGEVVYQD